MSTNLPARQPPLSEVAPHPNDEESRNGCDFPVLARFNNRWLLADNVLSAQEWISAERDDIVSLAEVR